MLSLRTHRERHVCIFQKCFQQIRKVRVPYRHVFDGYTRSESRYGSRVRLRSRVGMDNSSDKHGIVRNRHSDERPRSYRYRGENRDARFGDIDDAANDPLRLSVHLHQASLKLDWQAGLVTALHLIVIVTFALVL